MPNIFTSDDVTFKVNIVFILIFSLALIFNSNSKRAGIWQKIKMQHFTPMFYYSSKHASISYSNEDPSMNHYQGANIFTKEAPPH